MKYRVIAPAHPTPVRLIEADTSLGAAERLLDHPIRHAEVWHHTFEGARATTYVTTDGWITVIHPSQHDPNLSNRERFSPKGTCDA